MQKIPALILLGIALQTFALAQTQSPEIDAASASTAIALLAGAIVVVRGRRR